MKKITLIIINSILFAQFLIGQTLNQDASWPNSSWTVEGTYDRIALISNPTTTANFSYDDDLAGSGSTDEIQVQSPTIDLTAASNAGETWIEVSHDYNYNYGTSFTLEYYDADTASWILWNDLPDNSELSSNWCASLASNTSSILDIGSFTASQLTGFRYRFNYDSSSVYGWGVCTSSPTITSQAPPSCLDPTAPSAASITATSADISWTSDDLLFNIEVVDVTGGGIFTSEATNTEVSNPYSLSGLSSGNDYEVYVQTNCGGGDTSAWVGPVSFTTECIAFDVPYTENFDSTSTGGSSSPNVPNCWSFIDGGAGYGYVRLSSSHSSNSFYIYNSYDSTGDYILVSPETNNLSSGANRVKFDVDGSLSQDLIVGTLSDPADGSTFTAIETITLATSDYESYVVNIPSGTDLYVGFKHGQTGSYYSYYLDNITVEPLPSCLELTDLATSDLTSSSVILSWTADSSQSLFNVEVVDVTDGGSVTGTSTHPSVTNPLTLTGLTANNDYEFYVQADCGGGDLSTWSGPASFYTGYCVPSNTSSLTYINSFSTTDANVNVDNASTGYTNSGYGDYSQDTAIETFPGGSFDFSASIVGGTAGFALWIDLNDDLVFDTATEVLFNTTSYGYGPFTGTIEIPSNLTEGNYRLRMMTDYNDSNPSAATGDSACSFDGTRGEVEDYTVTVGAAPADAMDWNNIQWLAPAVGDGSRTSLNIDVGTSITAYAQGFEGGVTDTTTGSAGAGIECWIGIHNENTDPATWPASSWSVATFDTEQGNNDEYKLTTADAPVGTNYVASRWRLNNAGFTYGGTNPSGNGETPGGPWDGTTNVSIQLVVNSIANDDCSGAIALTVNSDLECGAVTSGSVEFATDSSVSNSTCYGIEDDDVWYSFVATSETHVVSLSNLSGFNTDMYHVLYAGDCNTLGDAIKCSDSDTSETSGLTTGNTYYVQVYTYTATPGQNTSFDICVGTPPPPPANDNCSGATVVDTLPFTSSADASTATNNGGSVLSCGTYGMNDGVWYTFTPTASGTLDLSVDVTGWDHEIAVYTGSCGVFTCVDFADNAGSSSTESLSISVTAGTQYWLNIGYYSSFDGSEGAYTFNATSSNGVSLGLDDMEISQFTYYPNPVNDVLTIKAQKTVEDITVYNMLGQVVKRQSPNTRDCTVDLSAMQTGAYFVQVSIDNTVETVRILKN